MHRTQKEEECREGEASTLCTDLYDMGMTDMIVDPGVRVAYEPDIAKALHDMDRVRIVLFTHRNFLPITHSLTR